VTNGVLGYQEAKSGESFLKIGVGELVKGSCGTCDSAEDYKFNSPYQFARPPVWTLEETDDNNNNSNSVILSHKAVLKQNDRQVGYKLEKRITLNDDQLLVKNVLTNLGSKAFSTAWYSHHFFTCDLHPVQRGYSVDVDLASTNGDYNEPTTWSWSTPLEDYASLNLHNSTSVRIDMQRGVESNVRIRAEFEKDEQSKGEFTLRACNTKIRETIPEVGDGSSGISMYAYNLYIESGTFSPEPQILLHLNPGESTSWTQQLDFEDNYPIVVEQKPRLPTKTKPSALLGSGSLVLQQQSEAKETASNSNKSRIAAIPAMALAIAIASIAYRSMVATTSRTRGRKQNYRLVPDAAIDDYPNYNRDDNDIESDAI
jgi:hypothetical protein